jgi:quinol monooxygenase YgiN
MTLFIFVRLHALAGRHTDVQRAACAVIDATRREPGCLGIQLYHSNKDGDLFYIHSQWRDEAAFEEHARLAHTRTFIATVSELIDHPLDVVRTTAVA